MNTSHNKNRIAELGWKNIIRNILGWYDETLIVSLHDNSNNNNNSNKKDNNADETTDISGRPNRNNQSQERNSQRRTNNSTKKDIFTISGVNNDIHADVNNPGSLPNSTFNEEVGCSSKSLENPEGFKNIFEAVKEMTDVYLERTKITIEKRTLSEESFQSETSEDIMKEQICSMILCLKENEQSYVIKFQNLVEFYNRCRDGKSPNGCKNRFFEDQPKVNSNIITKNRGNGKSQTKGTKSKNSKSYDTKSKDKTKASNEIYSKCNQEMKGERKKRMKVRSELLTKLYTCHDKDKKGFETLFNTLIDFEEKLIA